MALVIALFTAKTKITFNGANILKLCQLIRLPNNAAKGNLSDQLNSGTHLCGSVNHGPL